MFMPFGHSFCRILIGCGLRTMSSSSRICRVAALQVTCTDDKAANLRQCTSLVEKAVDTGARLIFLPEAFDFVAGSPKKVLELAERIDGATISAYRALAGRLGVWLSLGGFHEKLGVDDLPSKVLNTHLLIDSSGDVSGEYSKTHLFSVDLPTLRLDEAAYVVPGRRLAAPVTTPAGQLALMVCYDLRFAEISLMQRRAGAEVLSYPSVFTVATGEAHWSTLLRARAIETQCYVVAAAQVGVHNAKRSSYGHTMIVDPWGRVLAEVDGEKTNQIIYADIDLDVLDKVRGEMPVMEHRRTDLYPEMIAIPQPPVAGRAITRNEDKFEFGRVTIDGDLVFHTTDLSYAFVNRKCVVPGHVLVASRRSVARLHQLSAAEVSDLFLTAQLVQRLMQRAHPAADSCTVCVQDGASAGQTIRHVHVHVLPRQAGDFAFNDEVYKRLHEHDTVEPPQWRDREEMRQECVVLRAHLLDIAKDL